MMKNRYIPEFLKGVSEEALNRMENDRMASYVCPSCWLWIAWHLYKNDDFREEAKRLDGEINRPSPCPENPDIVHSGGRTCSIF